MIGIQIVKIKITFIFVIDPFLLNIEKNYLLLFLFVLFASSAFSQISKTHYIPALTSDSGNAQITEAFIYISTPSVDNVNYTIQEIGGAVVADDVINNTNPIRYTVPGSGTTQLVASRNSIGNVINNRGYIITADCPIYVSVRYNVPNQAGAFTSKGAAGLGARFRTAMYPNGTLFTAVQAGDFLSYVSILATKNNTKIRATLPNANAATEILVGGVEVNYTGPIET